MGLNLFQIPHPRDRRARLPVSSFHKVQRQRFDAENQIGSSNIFSYSFSVFDKSKIGEVPLLLQIFQRFNLKFTQIVLKLLIILLFRNLEIWKRRFLVDSQLDNYP